MGETELSTTRLSDIEAELKRTLESANDYGRKALEAGNRAGELLHEAESIHGRDGSSYKHWLESQRIPREKAKAFVQLHIDWPQIQQRLDSQTMLPFAEARRLAKDKPEMDGAMWRDDLEVGDNAYQIPETVSEDFEYPGEGDEEHRHHGADAIAGFMRFVVPRRLNRPEDWRTFAVRVMGTAFLLGVVPDNVSMRDACKAMGVSHATISKFVRELADKTGMRCPQMKRESTRETYSQVQRENHWRHREQAQ